MVELERMVYSNLMLCHRWRRWRRNESHLSRRNRRKSNIITRVAGVVLLLAVLDNVDVAISWIVNKMGVLQRKQILVFDGWYLQHPQVSGPRWRQAFRNRHHSCGSWTSEPWSFRERRATVETVEVLDNPILPESRNKDQYRWASVLVTNIVDCYGRRCVYGQTFRHDRWHCPTLLDKRRHASIMTSPCYYY